MKWLSCLCYTSVRVYVWVLWSIIWSYSCVFKWLQRLIQMCWPAVYDTHTAFVCVCPEGRFRKHSHFQIAVQMSLLCVLKCVCPTAQARICLLHWLHSALPTSLILEPTREMCVRVYVGDGNVAAVLKWSCSLVWSFRMNQSVVTSEVRAGGMDHCCSNWNTHFRLSVSKRERERERTDRNTYAHTHTHTEMPYFSAGWGCEDCYTAVCLVVQRHVNKLNMKAC